MADKYLPLYLMDVEDRIREDCGLDMEKLEKNGFPKCKDEMEYLNRLIRLYLKLDSDFEKTMSSIIYTYYDHMKCLGLLNNDDPKSMLCDIYDICARPSIYQIWKKNKQVYKPDKDFISALIKTENLKLSLETFKRLPCKHFYIDVMDCDMFLPVKGIFVNIFEVENKIMLVAYAVNEEAFWSTYDILDFNVQDDYEMKIDDLITGNGEYNYNQFDLFLMGKKAEKNVNGLDSNESKFFIYQLITYLTSHEPQFEESSITKSTYRPPKQGSVIKNKFSEIQMYDIGVRFGKSFREQKRRNKCNTILTKHLEHARKSPIPHFRAAHWQGYWVGRGRTEHIVKWIEPIFVNGEVEDVVIHKI